MTALKTVALFGECMIELQGEAFGGMHQSFGGDTLNTAIYLARAGARRGIRASFATALGTDLYSEGMLARWRSEGVDTSLVRHLPDRMPGLYAINVGADGERHFSYWRDHSAARSYFEVALTPLEADAPRLDALYFSGISLAILAPASRDRLLAVASTVHRNGGLVVFDNNYRPKLWASAAEARAAFGEAYALADIALVTIDDERQLHADWSAESALRHCLELPCPEVVVKRGAASTWVRAADGRHEVATQAVPRPVDTTAAGDSFAGAYLAFRLSGKSPAASARAGNALAARVVQHRGAIIASSLMADLLE